jgi:hypothetical protein
VKKAKSYPGASEFCAWSGSAFRIKQSHVAIVPTLIGPALLFGSRKNLPAAPSPTPTQAPKVILDTTKAKGLVYAPIPEYPNEALKNHWGGFGIFEVQFRRDGKPWAVYVTMPPGQRCRMPQPSARLAMAFLERLQADRAHGAVNIRDWR